MSIALYQRRDQAPASWAHTAPVDHLSQAAAPTGLGDVWGASMDDALVRNPFPSLMRMIARAADTSELLDPDEANQRFGISLDGQDHLTFTTPVTINKARELHQLKQEELARQYILSRAPQNFATGATQFTAGFIGSFFDPINVAVSMLPISWAGKVLQGGAQAARLTRTAKLIERTNELMRVNTAARIAGQAAEGAIGNALVEPFVLMAAQDEQADYGLQDSVMSLIFGAGMGATFAGAGALFRHLRPETRLMATRALAADADPALVHRAVEAVDPVYSAIAAMRDTPPAPDAPRTGDFGPIFHEHRADARAAIERLMREQTGEVPNALYHPDAGFIDLIWGDYDPITSNGYGLKKIWHKHVLEQKDLSEADFYDLQNYILKLKVKRRDLNTIVLESETSRAVIKLDWHQKKKTWLLTAFDKNENTSARQTVSSDDGPPQGGAGSVVARTDAGNEYARINNNSQAIIENTDQQAHLQRARQLAETHRQKRARELYQHFTTTHQPAPQSVKHSGIPDHRTQLEHTRQLIAEKQQRDTISKLPESIRREIQTELDRATAEKDALLNGLAQLRSCLIGV